MSNYVAQVLTFADIEGGETFDAALLGTAEEVVEDRVSDDDIILIKGAKSSRAVGTLIPIAFGF
jgi:T-complex protein 1 subunit alpha